MYKGAASTVKLERTPASYIHSKILVFPWWGLFQGDWLLPCFGVHALTTAGFWIVVAMTASLLHIVKNERDSSSVFERKGSDPFSRGKAVWALTKLVRMGVSDHSAPRLMPTCS